MTLPFRRRSDTGGSPHERARAAAAARLDGPLEPAEADWLAAHLGDCAACSAIADAYAADRSELRMLRRQHVEPPRDLWARTAAAIEREAASAATPPRRPPLLRRARPAPVPIGALAGVLVIAVVFGASLLGGRPAPSVVPQATPRVAVASDPPATLESPAPTRIVVTSGDVDWIAVGDGGQLLFHQGSFSEVCSNNGAECPTVRSTALPIAQVTAAGEVLISPDDEQLVVVDHSAEGGSIVVIPVPTPQQPIGGPTDPPPSDVPTATPSPTATPTPSPTPSPTASATDDPIEPSPSDAPPSDAPPSDPPPSDAPISIVDDVIVVGETAFSPDGTRLAFSARPADGSHGPDIFVWTVGELLAAPITDDHVSVFSGWAGELVLGSRAALPVGVEEPAGSAEPSVAVEPSASPSPDTSLPPAEPVAVETFVIDPTTGVRAVIEAAGWRPSVDPTGTRAVYWEGTIELDETGVAWRPAEGRLVLGPWPGIPALPEPVDPDASGEPGASAEPSSTPSPSDPPSPVAPDASTPPIEIQALAEGVVDDWEAKWDSTGTRLAVWIADADDAVLGKLSLYDVGAEGTVDLERAPLREAPALPGFAIDDGHLAWATKKGQDGKSSHVKVLAWRGAAFGQIETQQGEDIVVVQH